MDALVARVLTALEKEGLRDNTIVIFIADHGYALGEHGLWQKQSVFERSARVPMIVAGPGIAQGQICGGPAELLDLYPTLADLCQVKTPTNLSGVSLRGQLVDPTTKIRNLAFSMVRDGRSIRTERWRYTEWSNGSKGVELYDHQTDPEELKNLALDPQLAATVAEMKTLLAAEAGK
jgi:arylsulfatase A-like enzyme